jgi:hypothetical protein
MTNYYIIDTTAPQKGQSPVLTFLTTEGVVAYLEKMCIRRFGKTRKQYMFSVSELGFGEDDQAGRSFSEQMEQYFNMGVIRKDSNPVRCNIFQADAFSRGKAEHGN